LEEALARLIYIWRTGPVATELCHFGLDRLSKDPKRLIQFVANDEANVGACLIGSEYLFVNRSRVLAAMQHKDGKEFVAVVSPNCQDIFKFIDDDNVRTVLVYFRDQKLRSVHNPLDFEPHFK
jgi:hypothetical protein